MELDTGKTIAIYYNAGKFFQISIEVYQDDQITLATKNSISPSFNTTPIKSVTIFPNPNKGEFTIELNTKVGNSVKVEVYSWLGQLVFLSNEKTRVYLFSKDILLNNVPDGIYYIKASTSAGNYSGKVIINQ